MPTILDWRDTLLDVGAVGFPGVVQTSGAFTTLIGSRPAYAKVVLRFERADDFEVACLPEGMSTRLLTYARSAILGALDILMTTHVYPIAKVKITVIELDDDEVKSTPRAFRLAARDAASMALREVGLG